MTLAQALERARTRNPELQAMRERVNASTARVDAARMQNRPRLGIELNAQRTDNAASVFASRLNAGEFGAQDFEIGRLNAPGALSHLGSSLVMEMKVDLAGRTTLAADTLAASSRASAQNLLEAEGGLRLQVTEAYFGAVLARRAKAAADVSRSVRSTGSSQPETPAVWLITWRTRTLSLPLAANSGQ